VTTTTAAVTPAAVAEADAAAALAEAEAQAERDLAAERRRYGMPDTGATREAAEQRAREASDTAPLSVNLS
jgi:regulator of protease activity HflC (stomatin/prohibitin superfamily)